MVGEYRAMCHTRRTCLRQMSRRLSQCEGHTCGPRLAVRCSKWTPMRQSVGTLTNVGLVQRGYTQRVIQHAHTGETNEPHYVSAVH